MEFKFEIGAQEFEYNHLVYTVCVERNHTVKWSVFGPNNATPLAQVGVDAEEVMEKGPPGIIRRVHEEARFWIDNYVSTHLKLQESMERAREAYGRVTE